METASAAKRGSTTPVSTSNAAWDSSMGEWADGTLYTLEMVWVNIDSTPPQGLIMFPSLLK